MTQSPYHHGDLKNALIQAGIEILARDGIGGLSLRRVAQQAGVSHAAPYAHFADKQALVAAICTAGNARLQASLQALAAQCAGDPRRELLGVAWAYIRFARQDTAHFKLTFSGAVAREKDYPALVAITQHNFEAVRQVVARAQAAGVLDSGSSDLVALNLWSQVHGLASLMLEGQISHTLLERYTPAELLVACLQPLFRQPLDVTLLEGLEEGS